MNESQELRRLQTLLEQGPPATSGVSQEWVNKIERMAMLLLETITIFESIPFAPSHAEKHSKDLRDTYEYIDGLRRHYYKSQQPKKRRRRS